MHWFVKGWFMHVWPEFVWHFQCCISNLTSRGHQCGLPNALKQLINLQSNQLKALKSFVSPNTTLLWLVNLTIILLTQDLKLWTGKVAMVWPPPSSKQKVFCFWTKAFSSTVSRASKNTNNSQTFPSTEIFSKRRKIYAWMKRNSSCNHETLGQCAITHMPPCSARVMSGAGSSHPAFLSFFVKNNNIAISIRGWSKCNKNLPHHQMTGKPCLRGCPWIQ